MAITGTTTATGTIVTVNGSTVVRVRGRTMVLTFPQGRRIGAVINAVAAGTGRIWAVIVTAGTGRTRRLYFRETAVL
jgi:hypothetical protein